MVLPLNTLSLVLLIVVTATHHTTGVQIKSVGLKSGLPYVKGRLPAQITYSLAMEEGETLQTVVWVLDDGIGSYVWQPRGSVRVFGILKGAINTSAANGELLFPNVLLNHAGNYNLTVRTSNGNATDTYKLIVFDYSKIVFSQSSTPLPSCTWSVQMTLYRVAPYPNVSCVFEDGIGANSPSVSVDAVAEVTTDITNHNNGTFNYEMSSNIPVQNVPMESSISCFFWIEDSSITLYEHKPSFAAQHCPEPFTVEDLNYIITSGYESCYGEYSLHAKVEYFCTDNPNLEPHKTLECGIEGNWTEIDETPYPNCTTLSTTKEPGSATTESVSTTAESNSTTAESNSTTAEPNSTPPIDTTTTDSGTQLTFHRILLTATFLISSYCILK